MHGRGALALATVLIVALFPARALAWQEAHQTGGDVEVKVESDGKATFRHALRWHVVRGPLRSIDLANVDPAAEIDGEVPVTAEDGHALRAHAARVEDRERRLVRISVDEPRALMHGTFTFDLSVHLDMVASRVLTRDGATWRLGLSAPVADDGFDGARTRLVLPAAPDAPRPIVADTGAFDDSVVSTLHREPNQDTLELVRPHVARGEAVSWTVRVDPRAFPQVLAPRLRTPAMPKLTPEPDRVQESILVAGLVAIGLVYGWLVRRKTRDAAGWGHTARATLAGVAVAAGVGLQLEDGPTLGAACIAVAVLAAATCMPRVKPSPRGPGRWLAIRPEDAFADVRAARWPLVLLATFLVTAAAAVGLSRAQSEWPWLVAIDASLLAPLLLGGREKLLPSAARWLERAFYKLNALSPRGEGAATRLRVSPWARVPGDAGRFDELRLLVLPRVAMPGVLGLEVGVAWASTPVGWAASPEVLARVLEESPAAARLAVELPSSRALPGRRPEERVVRMLPRVPTQASTVTLVRALVEALTDRRMAVPSVVRTGPERRVKSSSTSAASGGSTGEGRRTSEVAA